MTVDIPLKDIIRKISCIYKKTYSRVCKILNKSLLNTSTSFVVWPYFRELDLAPLLLHLVHLSLLSDRLGWGQALLAAVNPRECGNPAIVGRFGGALRRGDGSEAAASAGQVAL